MIAPTYLANAVTLLFVLFKVFSIELPYTAEEVQNAVTILLVVGTPIFTMVRQLITGRATVFGAKGRQQNRPCNAL